MKAVLCKAHGGPDTLVVENVAAPSLKPGHIRVAIHAAGVNFPDTLIIRGKYQFKPDFPFSPGGEMAGVVTEVAGDVSGFKSGDRVLAMSTWGAFAEEIVVPAYAAAHIPDSMDYATAAGFIITYGTTYHALADRGRMKPGETLLVLGAAGGVGLAAVELGKALGARVIAAASTADKLAVAKGHGADELIAYGSEDLKERVRSLTNGQGADVIYDPVGGDATKAALSAINWRGRLLVVGFASGTIPDIPANRTLIKGCDIVGIFWGDYIRREPARFAGDFAELTRLYETGKIKPLVSATYALEQAAEALKVIEDRKAVGKIVLKVR